MRFWILCEFFKEEGKTSYLWDGFTITWSFHLPDCNGIQKAIEVKKNKHSPSDCYVKWITFATLIDSFNVIFNVAFPTLDDGCKQHPFMCPQSIEGFFYTCMFSYEFHCTDWEVNHHQLRRLSPSLCITAWRYCARKVNCECALWLIGEIKLQLVSY